MSGSENWKAIEGWEGLYEVSDQGQVRSLDRYVTQLNSRGGYTTRIYYGKILLPREGKYGYLYLHLSKAGKRTTKKIHRLVAENWIPNPEGKPQVNHLNGKLNNSISDLEWSTDSENKQHAIDTGLKLNPFGAEAHNFKGEIEVWKDGVVIDILKGHKDILEKGYTSCGISAVFAGRQHTHRGCHFKRVTDE